MYRLHLLPNNCSLLIEKFNPLSNAYESYFSCVSSHYTSGTCTSLTVRNGTLNTEKGNLYSKLPDNDYIETSLILDDNGVVKLEGLVEDSKNKNSNVYKTTVIVIKGNETLDDFVEVHQTLN